MWEIFFVSNHCWSLVTSDLIANTIELYGTKFRPLYRGTLSTVNLKDILYVPQRYNKEANCYWYIILFIRPYLTLGNFRAQVIYPDSVEEMQSKGWTDELLLDVLKVIFEMLTKIIL